MTQYTEGYRKLFGSKKKKRRTVCNIKQKAQELTQWELLNSTPEGKELIKKYRITKEGINESSKKFDNMTKEEWRQFQIDNPIGEINFKKLDQ